MHLNLLHNTWNSLRWHKHLDMFHKGQLHISRNWSFKDIVKVEQRGVLAFKQANAINSRIRFKFKTRRGRWGQVLNMWESRGETHAGIV